MQKEQSTAGKILLLLRRMHVQPLYILIPVGLSLVSAVFEGAGISLLIPILNGFLTKSFSFVMTVPILGTLFAHLPPSILQNDRALFSFLLGGFIVLFITKNIVRCLCALSVYYFSERSLHHLRKALFKRYLSFGKLFFDGSNIGHHSTLLLEFSRLALTPLQAIDRFIAASFSLLVYLVLMLFISWKLTLIALPLFFFLHIVVRLMILRIRRVSYALADRASSLGKKSIEILSTIPLVKSHRTEEREQRHFTELSDQKARLDFRIDMIGAIVLPIQEIITVIVAVTIFMGALMLLGRENIASAPAILVFFYIVMNGSQKLGAVSGFRSTLATASGPLDQVLTMFDERGKFFVKGGGKECTGLREAIALRNLHFRYSEDRTVLDDVSFTMHKGTMTAIVGPTGAGKSTLISLLMRYYDCPPGTIFFDEVDVRDFTLDSYLKHIAFVSQETLLLHDSLHNNITYGLSDVSEEAVRDVVRRSRLEHFVSQLPEGLNTLIGDRGVKLSGGEKQRVSIARALLRGAEILILDEATSSLDSQTEKLIQEAIDEAVAGRTAIVIAHRLSTIKHADKIVVFQEGKVVEQGTLDQLLQRKGVFFHLWEEQKF
ncbi:ABC transporter ATP-binding protein [Candidatus Peregrinibacteria bacterium]|nr:ABC transporter ATP-binding protein [Candidatus Peregrinibacteria bacterium]MBI3816140.1 ABC transporter ATP-binding protein [Candidatus Peregrinibacteria bacterium]